MEILDTANQTVTLIVGVGTAITIFGNIISALSARSAERQVRNAAGIISALIASDVEDAFLSNYSRLANLRIGGVTLKQQIEAFAQISPTSKILRQGMRSLAFAKQDNGAARKTVMRYWRLYDRYFEKITDPSRSRDGRTLLVELRSLLTSGKDAYETLFQKFDDHQAKNWDLVLTEEQTSVEFIGVSPNRKVREI